MDNPIIEQVLKIFELDKKQSEAAKARNQDVVVTAGAGSGKTRTLVARYISLLAEGATPREIAAITFTKKAAREMRSRVRGNLMKLQQVAETEDERRKWADFSAQMDSARIGTIHSLCTEILLSHPAEAGVDPRFKILDESLSMAYKIQAVEDTLKELVSEDKFGKFLPLLKNIPVRSLTEILQDLLERRLEADELFNKSIDNRTLLTYELKQRLSYSALMTSFANLHTMSDSDLRKDAGDKLAEMVKELLPTWTAAEDALQKGDPYACANLLFQARRNLMRGKIGSAGSVKETIKEIREAYKKMLFPLIGGEGTHDPEPSLETEALFERLLPLLKEAFNHVHKAYKAMLENRQALDFDDLEFGTRQLMQIENIRNRWQGELKAILVDEFQDTNQRQREIIEALAGKPGRLFIVGDMRQSIYRFRHADVTVFKDEQERIKSKGGLLRELDENYRTHEPLLQAMGDLLSEVIGTQPDPDRKYYVPYTPMVAHEKNPSENYKSPHVEFVFGMGEDTDSARPLAARALTERLLQLKEELQITNWDEVALLFRASTGFPYYEEALEDSGIPFVTVAGKGFYDRPEIRDLVNILHALADPMDDLSFAGLLRSPAFGMSDDGLYILHKEKQPFWTSLQGDISKLCKKDQQSAERTRRIVTSLLPLVDRVPVAELLKQVVDTVDYRAILASADRRTGEQDASASGGRLWRNLDKLLEDAQIDQQVSTLDFLDRIKILNDAGAREGEAPAEAEGAVRLMTIHRSKGLEFPVVVLADAGRQKKASREKVYLSYALGVTFKLDQAPMLYNLAKTVNKDQECCEALRLLYVALTRTKNKLLISAHAKMDEDGKFQLSAWAKDLSSAAGLLSHDFQEKDGKPFEQLTSSNQPIRVWCLLADLPIPMTNQLAAKEKPPKNYQPPLYSPIQEEIEIDKLGVAESEFEPQDWRATMKDYVISGKIVGKLIHKAIQRWLFPGDPRLIRLLAAEAFNIGIATEKQRMNAIHQTTELLERLHQHPIWEEIETALERHHELPYSKMVDDNAETGYLDILYRTSAGWQIVDFKTDSIRTAEKRADLVDKYSSQMRKYATAVETLMGQKAQTRICFLDDQGKVELVEISN